MKDDLPILTNVITPKDEMKARTAFYIAFFNCEQMRERLAKLGYGVAREISYDDAELWSVRYTFHGVPGGLAANSNSVVEVISLEYNNPFKTRELLLGRFHDAIQHFSQVRDARLSLLREQLEASLSPSQLQELSLLRPADLATIIRFP